MVSSGDERSGIRIIANSLTDGVLTLRRVLIVMLRCLIFGPLVRRPDLTVQASVQKAYAGLCASALFMMSTECEDLLKIAAASVREYDITFSRIGGVQLC